MTERFYVHVGPHKTGTTYLQGLLTANQKAMAAAGVLFPRETWRKQSWAIRDVLRSKPMPASGREVRGEWRKLLDEVRAWTGQSAVVSHEMLSSATDKEIARLVRQLKEWDVHVVYSARDLTRVAPAMWQTRLRSKQNVTWTDYARSLRRSEGNENDRWGETFWHEHDAAELLARWGKHLSREQLHVVTVPPSGSPPELLWQRFCSVLGIGTDGHHLDPPRSNPSLGTAEAELLRRVNETLSTSRIAGQAHLRWARWLGRQLEGRSAAARFTLPPEDFDWMAERSEQITARLRDGGYPVTGDLADLSPRPVAPDKARHPEDASDAAVVDAAVDAIRHLVVRLAADRSAEPSED